MGYLKIVNFPFWTNGKLIILGVPILKHITVFLRPKNSMVGQDFFVSGEPGLVDRVLTLHAGSRGFDSHSGHMSERFFRSNRPGYPHPVSSELENSGIREAVGDFSVTERQRWRPTYQTSKTVHVHAKHYKHNKDGRTVPGVCGNGSVPLSHSGNVVMRIGIHTQDFFFQPFMVYIDILMKTLPVSFLPLLLKEASTKRKNAFLEEWCFSLTHNLGLVVQH